MATAIEQVAEMAQDFVATRDLAAFATPDEAVKAFTAVRKAAHGAFAGETHPEALALATPAERQAWERAYVRAALAARDAVYLAAKRALAAR